MINLKPHNLKNTAIPFDCILCAVCSKSCHLLFYDHFSFFRSLLLNFIYVCTAMSLLKILFSTNESQLIYEYPWFHFSSISSGYADCSWVMLQLLFSLATAFFLLNVFSLLWWFYVVLNSFFYMKSGCLFEMQAKNRSSNFQYHEISTLAPLNIPMGIMI